MIVKKKVVKGKSFFFENKFPTIKKLISHLTCYDKNSYNYFNKWVAFILQNPEVKLATSFVFKGTQGTGKGTLAKLVLTPIFGFRNIGIATNNTLKKGWGSYVKDKRLVICEEIYLKENTDSYQMIKDYSSNSAISIERKNREDEIIDNYSHWLFFTNEENPFKIERGDRRHTIFEQQKKLPDRIYDELENNGFEVIQYASYLLNLEVEKNEVNKTLDNEFKNSLIEQNLDIIEKFHLEIKKFDKFESFLKYIKIEAHEEFLSEDEIKGGYIENSKFYLLFKRWCDFNLVRNNKSNIVFTNFINKKLELGQIKLKNNQNGRRIKDL